MRDLFISFAFGVLSPSLDRCGGVDQLASGLESDVVRERQGLPTQATSLRSFSLR